MKMQEKWQIIDNIMINAKEITHQKQETPSKEIL